MKISNFDKLAREVAECRLCPRMDDRNRVLSLANGPLDARLMFIGEAPGRLGADATKIPFHGDKAGDNFEKLLSQVGLDRYQCFITNAALCNPRSDDGNNTPPTKTEIANCTTFLRRQIELVDPLIVATLGAQSLAALDMIFPHGLRLAESVRKSFSWGGRILMPLYHPGQRAMIHRSFLNQLADYQLVAETLKRKTGKKRNGFGGSKQIDELVRYCVRALIRHAGELAYFRLHKLFYLLEYAHFRDTGERLSHAYIIRQKDGPYITDLNVGVLRRKMDDIQVVQSGSKISLRLRSTPSLFEEVVDDAANESLNRLIDTVWSKYGTASNDQLKTAVYMTSPMRSLLRAEKYGHRSTFNQPVEFGSH